MKSPLLPVLQKTIWLIWPVFLVINKKENLKFNSGILNVLLFDDV